MSALLKIMVTLGVFFASTFIILNATGVVSVEKIEALLASLKQIHVIYVALLIIALLFADLVFSVPTLTVMMLGGYFIGPVYAALSAITGLVLAGVCGYVISRKYGYVLINVLVRDEEKRGEAAELFQRYGAVIILLSRAMPMLPEVSACMAGMTKIPFLKFITLWLISIVPYAFIASYAGSISSLDNPKPALFTAIGFALFFWTSWFVFDRYRKKQG